MYDFLDENNSIHKLKGLAPIYWLNLDSDTKRRDYMLKQFDYWQVEKHTRVSGYDGRIDNLDMYLIGNKPKKMSDPEIGCCLSHIKAIKEFYKNTDQNYALILEDDIMFETVKYWNFRWEDFFLQLPYDWDCVQLSITSTGVIHVALHPHFVNDFSVAAYLISRHHAEKIIKNHVKDKKYKLDNGVKPRAVSEDTILGSGKTYSIPLLLSSLDLGSTIHPEHVHKYHRESHEIMKHFWKNKGSEVNLDALMNYDPYLRGTTWKSLKPYEEKSK